MERTVKPEKLAAFMEVYEPALAQAAMTYPKEYGFIAAEVPFVAERIRFSLKRGTYNHDGRAFKATCKALGIKHTRTAIEAYLND